MKASRRQFLRGAGGFTLALPFLDSLFRGKASAGEAPYAEHPRFVCMTTQHGGVWGSNMFPGDAVASSSQDLYPGFTGHWGQLSASPNGGTTSLSPVLSAPSEKLPPEIVARMNVVRGLDVPFYLGHHTGGDLGNYARNDGEGDNPMEYRPTIDQVMAYSSSFYPDLSSIRARSMHIGTHVDHTWGYSNPQSQSGDLQPMPLSGNALSLFNSIFVPDDGPDPRPLVVDRVIESYRRLHDGAFGDARRLSAKDKQRLDDHMDRLYDLQTRLNATADCSDVPVLTENTDGLDVGGYSANTDDMRAYYELYNRVIVAAFTCGTSRIAVINSGETWSTVHPGLCCDWHQLVAHEAHANTQAQQWLADAQRMFFEWVFLDLVNKLHAVKESNDISILDNSLVFWTQEAGSTTHDQLSLPVVMAGSAAGVWETGRYIDYRNRQNTAFAHDYSPEHANLRPGLPYNRFLANVMMAMGLAPSEFERPGEHGYGLTYTERSDVYTSQMMNDASLPLPLLVKG
jgi:hypothetical protein